MSLHSVPMPSGWTALAITTEERRIIQTMRVHCWTDQDLTRLADLLEGRVLDPVGIAHMVAGAQGLVRCADCYKAPGRVCATHKL